MRLILNFLSCEFCFLSQILSAFHPFNNSVSWHLTAVTATSSHKSTTLDSRSCFNLFMDSQQWPLGHFDVTTLDRTGKAESSSNQEEQKDLITSNIWNTRLAVNRQMLHIMQPHTHVTIHTWTMGWWKGLEVLWDLLMWKQMNRSILTTCNRNTFSMQPSAVMSKVERSQTVCVRECSSLHRLECIKSELDARHIDALLPFRDFRGGTTVRSSNAFHPHIYL